jgi:hypothetical protein
MTKDEVLEKLKDDNHYYGKFGKQYLSNSDISALLKDPLSFKAPSPMSSAFLVGGYFHTSILEPDKIDNFKIIESSTRNTKKYKEISEGELCLLQHEADKIELMREKLLKNNICRDYIRGSRKGARVKYEQPGIVRLFGNMWKGKADIINEDEQLIIDLKTSADISKFKWSANKYNYDSQAYIYKEMFGYDMLFIVMDKTTHQIGIFDCSDEFYESGRDKVVRATEAYELFFKTDGFDPSQFFLTKTL